MKSLAGAIVVLAGSVALGLGAIAQALRPYPSEPTVQGTVATGGFLVGIGILILLLGFVVENKPKT